MSDNFNIIKSQIINSHSCCSFLRSLGCNVYRQAQTIHAPSFIRKDLNPSFAVYDDHCFDFSTQTYYNILDLYALYHFNSSDFSCILKAAEALSGKSISYSSESASSQYIQQQQAFNDLINQYHQNLLQNPVISPDGKKIKALDYFASRRISLNTIKALKIGYAPSGNDYMHDRLIFPYYSFSSTQPSYANGRAAIPANEHFPKYKKLALNDSRFDLILHNSVWGANTQKPGKIINDTRINPDTGETETLETHSIIYDYLIVSEGQFDTLAFYQEGFQIASSLGCSFSAEQKKELLQMARHYADNNQKVFLCLDNDNAGNLGAYNLALFFFKNRIPFVVGHLPQSFTVCLEGHPHFGETVHIKDVSDYYSAGGDLEALITAAKPGVTILAEHCRNQRELGELFQNTAKFADKLDLFDLKEAAYRVMDDNGSVEGIDKETGETITITDKKPRFSRSAVNFLYNMASQSLLDSVVAELTTNQRKLLYDTAGQFYEYEDGVWRAVPDLIVQKYVAEIMKGKLSANKLGAVCKYLKITLGQANLQFNTKPIWVFRNGTLWLDEDGETVETVTRRREVRDENGQVVIDPKYAKSSTVLSRPLYEEYQETAVTMKPNPDNPSVPANFKPSTPEDMASIQMPYDYKYGVKNLTWEKYVAEWMNNDTVKITLLQQMFGYVLFAANRLQKFFYLIGDGANGKSTALHILEAVFGKDNCSALQFHRFGSEFDAISLKNSRVNICYDAKSELGGAEEIIKAASSGDALMAAHKGVDAETFIPNAKIFVAANKFFSASDVSRGLLRRILFLCFDRTFEGENAKPDIEDEIKNAPGGLAGVFNWAYEGYKALKASGRFIETDEQKKLVEEFKTQLSPLMVFAREQMYTRFGCELDEKELFSLFKNWCEINCEKKISRTKFIYEIRQVLRTDGSPIKTERDAESGLWRFLFPDPPEGYYTKDTERFEAVAEKTKPVQKKEAPADERPADACGGEFSGHEGQADGTLQGGKALQEDAGQIAADHAEDSDKESAPQNHKQTPAKKSAPQNHAAASTHDDPNEVMDAVPFAGMTNAEIWRMGEQCADALSKYGRHWKEAAKNFIHNFRLYRAMNRFFSRHTEASELYLHLLKGYWDFWADEILPNFDMADDELGTMIPITQGC